MFKYILVVDVEDFTVFDSVEGGSAYRKCKLMPIYLVFCWICTIFATKSYWKKEPSRSNNTNSSR